MPAPPSKDSRNIQDRRAPAQRNLQRFKEKYPEFAKPKPGIDRTAPVKVPYARVNKPRKGTSYFPDKNVPGYGPNATGGTWRSKYGGPVVGTSKSPTSRITRVKPPPGATATPRPPKSPQRTSRDAAAAAANRPRNPGLYPTSMANKRSAPQAKVTPGPPRKKGPR